MHVISQESQKIIDSIQQSVQKENDTKYKPYKTINSLYMNLCAKFPCDDVLDATFPEELISIFDDQIKSAQNTMIDDEFKSKLAKIAHCQKYIVPMTTIRITTMNEAIKFSQHLIKYYCDDYRFFGFEDIGWTLHNNGSSMFKMRKNESVLVNSTSDPSMLSHVNNITELLSNALNQYFDLNVVKSYIKKKEEKSHAFKWVFIVIKVVPVPSDKGTS